MKRLSKFLAGAALLMAGFVTLSAFGAHNWWHHGELTQERADHIASMVVDRLFDTTNATPEQRTQINAIKDQRVRDTVAFVQANKPVKEAFLKEWQSEKPDAKAVHALIDQRIDALRKMAHQAADDALEVHDIFKPEQRAAITEHLKNHFAPEEEPTTK